MFTFYGGGNWGLPTEVFYLFFGILLTFIYMSEPYLSTLSVYMLCPLASLHLMGEGSPNTPTYMGITYPHLEEINPNIECIYSIFRKLFHTSK